jgi:hypothetical protein
MPDIPDGLERSLSAFPWQAVSPYGEILRQGASQSERLLSMRNGLRVIKVFASCTGERIHCSVKLAQ